MGMTKLRNNNIYCDRIIITLWTFQIKRITAKNRETCMDKIGNNTDTRYYYLYNNLLIDL